MSESPQRNLLIALAMSPLHRAVICRLGTTVRVWASVRGVAATRETAQRLGVPITQLRRALDLRRHAGTLAREETRLADQAEARIVTILDHDYPADFRTLPLPPPVLYLRGTLIPERPASTDAGSAAQAPGDAVTEGPTSAAHAPPTIAMVGSRTPDHYGKTCAERFARSLAAAGLTIASGFARGVDQACHRAALDSPDGRTVAVLGCGIDIDYPSRSRHLANAISSRGALLTELPMGTEPRPHHFPMRNRLIAALGIGVVVVQAKVRSGSLVTAHHALDLGRDVWAIPGPIDSALAGGPNGLIADGAMLVQAPEEILTTLSLGAQQTLFPSCKGKSRKVAKAGPKAACLETTTARGMTEAGAAKPRGASPNAPAPRGLPRQILDALEGRAPCTVESLAEGLTTPVDRILVALLELELAGLVDRLPGPLYARL